MTYLITGATGDVGARVVELLVRRGLRRPQSLRNWNNARNRTPEGLRQPSEARLSQLVGRSLLSDYSRKLDSSCAVD
jgi:nucleoside-diphosphate-sugar epimerase